MHNSTVHSSHRYTYSVDTCDDVMVTCTHGIDTVPGLCYMYVDITFNVYTQVCVHGTCTTGTRYHGTGPGRYQGHQVLVLVWPQAFDLSIIILVGHGNVK